MKILYFFRDYGTVMFSWQREHIVDELNFYGIEIEIINPLDFNSYEQANYVLIKKLKSQSYDLFMTCHNEEVLFFETLDEIKRIGVPTLLFCPDNLLAPYNHEKIASKFDLVWLTSQETKYLFDRWGCKSLFLPYAANPFLLKPDYSLPEIQRLGFIGTPHGTRMDYINRLVDVGIPVTVHTGKTNVTQKVIAAPAQSYMHAMKAYLRYPIGRKLLLASVVDKAKKRSLHLDSTALILEPQVPFGEMAKYCCAYAAMLSFSEAKSTGVLNHPVPIINLRHFELPMSGALQFTMYNDEIASYFEEGKEIILCLDKADYIDKAKFYLKPEQASLRRNMKIAARKRAEAEHTWKNRYDVIFRELGLH